MASSVGTVLRALLHFLLALCTAVGVVALCLFLAYSVAPDRAVARLLGVLFFSSVLFLGGLSAGALLGRLLESPTPNWRVVGFGLVVGSLWGLGLSPEDETTTYRLDIVALRVLPSLTFAVGCVVGAALSQRRRDGLHQQLKDPFHADTR